jgi:hypothetical protein
MRTNGGRLAILFTLLLGVGACSTTEPSSSAIARLWCEISEDCEEVLAAAAKVVSLDESRIFVAYGEGQEFHAEVHICHRDGRYILVDVTGDDLTASVRAEPRSVAPCV